MDGLEPGGGESLEFHILILAGKRVNLSASGETVDVRCQAQNANINDPTASTPANPLYKGTGLDHIGEKNIHRKYYKTFYGTQIFLEEYIKFFSANLMLFQKKLTTSELIRETPF